VYTATENIERVKSSLVKSNSANKENVKYKNNLKQIVATAAFTFLIMLNFCFLIHSVNANVLEPIAKSSTDPLKHFIDFDEVGQLASSMTYILVQMPVNLTSIYQQAEVMSKYSNNLIAHPLSDNVHSVFSKAIKTTVIFYFKRLERKMNQFINIDKNLPPKSNHENAM
jgi:hypothetical protein